MHNEPVYGISIDPTNDNIFTTGGDNGQLLITDLRDPPSLGIDQARFSFKKKSLIFY
jgi:hypothetical protein